MSELDLDAIRARCDAATKGPWNVVALTCPNGNAIVDSITGAGEPQWSDYGEGEGEWFTDSLVLVETDMGVYGPTMPDAQFIAAARTDVPALLAHIEELERERDEALAELSTLRKDYDSVLEANVGLLDDAPWADVRRAYIRGAEAMREACAARVGNTESGTVD